MPLLTTSLCLAATATLAAAQADWGTVGAWELMAPATAGPALAYRGATTSTGCFVVTANDTDGVDGGAVGSTRAYAYDVAANAWRAWPDLPVIADPFAFDVGGQVFVVDETNNNNVAFIDASAARSRIGQTWTVPAGVTGGPAGRFGMRMAPFGSVVYALGGVEIATGIAHNDIWAIGAGTIITGQALPPPAWSQVAPDGVVGIPPPRVGYSLAVFGTVILLFGGVSVLPTAPAGTLPDVCFTPATSAACEFHSHVWAFRPGNPGPPSEITVTGAQWQLLSGGVSVAPTGRFDMTGGAIGDQLYVYGGTTAVGPSNELWAFNLVSQTWAQVAPSAPAPAPITDLGYGVGAVLGRHLYHYAQAADANGPIAGTGQLWRWAPLASSGNAAPAAAGGASMAIINGHTAGIALTVVLTMATLAVSLLSALQLGALPAWSASCCAWGAAGGSRAKAGALGFYSSSSPNRAAANGGYVAPPDVL